MKGSIISYNILSFLSTLYIQFCQTTILMPQFKMWKSHQWIPLILQSLLVELLVTKCYIIVLQLGPIALEVLLWFVFKICFHCWALATNVKCSTLYGTNVSKSGAKVAKGGVFIGWCILMEMFCPVWPYYFVKKKTKNK